MVKNEKNQELMSHFIEQLEAYGLEIGSKLDQMETDKNDYLFFERIKKELEESKIEFCSSYFALTEEEKAFFQKQLLALFKDQEIVDNILQEIVNLYYLKEYGLLDLEEIAPQKEVALENLETLLTKVTKYLNDTNFDQLSKTDEKLSERMDRLVTLGSILEGDENVPIDDVDFLEETLEYLSLTPEEKKQVLIEIIHHNIAVYHTHLEKKKENIPIEQSIEIEELRENPVISAECMTRMNELLSDKKVIERIMQIVNDEFTTVISMKAPTPEEQEQITSSIELAREEMIESMKQDESMTPEEALDVFFQKYDDTTEHKRELIAQITETTEASPLTREEQEEIVGQAFAFLEEQQMYLRDINKNDKEKIRQYMLGLFQNVENRRLMIDSGIYEDRSVLEREAAYEISVYKELLEAVPKEDTETYAKICTKLQEILDVIGVEKEPVPKEETEEGKLFFVMDGDTSTIESDIGVGGKGLASTYYGEIKSQLLSIANRHDRRIGAAQPVNPGLKALKKQGVRFTTGVRTKVFFIPVGLKDAIIVGTSFLTGKDVSKDQEKRVKKYQTQIETLKEQLSSPDTYEEEVKKASVVQSRIMSTLNNKELDEMLQSAAEQEETKEKAK